MNTLHRSVVVDATLDSDNPVPFTIADNPATTVTGVFDIDGDLVPMQDGALDIDVEFDEDDGSCTPGSFGEEIFAANSLLPQVELVEGQVYTVEAVDTFGWQSALGALPGSTSSMGSTRHKNLQLLATPCE